MNYLSRKSNEDGFTLIELLIVIVVIGILAAIVLFAVGNTKSDASKAACQADYRTIKSAQEAYKATASAGNGSYAGSVGALSPNFLKSDPGDYTTSTSGDVVAITSKCTTPTD